MPVASLGVLLRVLF